MSVLIIKNYAGVINLVGEEKVSIKELVNEIIAISGMNPKINIIEKIGPARDLIFNNSKMRELLCKPKVRLKEGLLKEWNYMKSLS